MARTKKAAARKSHFARGSHRRNRSRLTKFRNKFETKIGSGLDLKGVPHDYEQRTIEYTQTRKYKPDFLLESSDGKQMIIEAKGLFEAEDRRKHVDVKKQHPELDIRFVFYADYKLRKGAKSTYSQWCDKHGFKYAIGDIPNSWLEELGYTIKEEEPKND